MFPRFAITEVPIARSNPFLVLFHEQDEKWKNILPGVKVRFLDKYIR